MCEHKADLPESFIYKRFRDEAIANSWTLWKTYEKPTKNHHFRLLKRYYIRLFWCANTKQTFRKALYINVFAMRQSRIRELHEKLMKNQRKTIIIDCSNVTIPDPPLRGGERLVAAFLDYHEQKQRKQSWISTSSSADMLIHKCQTHHRSHIGEAGGIGMGGRLALAGSISRRNRNL